MSRKCEVCGKGPQIGHTVSHANNKAKRRFMPNLQRVRVICENGGTEHKCVCTRCLRDGRVTKVPVKIPSVIA